jgi:hypothetical protein
MEMITNGVGRVNEQWRQHGKRYQTSNEENAHIFGALALVAKGRGYLECKRYLQQFYVRSEVEDMFRLLFIVYHDGARTWREAQELSLTVYNGLPEFDQDLGRDPKLVKLIAKLDPDSPCISSEEYQGTIRHGMVQDYLTELTFEQRQQLIKQAQQLVPKIDPWGF